MRYSSLALCLSLFASPALAEPPGLVSAELLPAAPTESGSLMTALHLQLEPGWKTYWRSPGESGVPPVIDWSGVSNVAEATPHWPQPELIESDGTVTLGYHDELVLPLELTLTDAEKPLDGKVTLDFGLCQNICVPAHIELALPETTDNPDPRIAEALANEPKRGAEPVSCSVTQIEDGLTVAASVDAQAEGAALELDAPGMWVSQPELSQSGETLTVTADFVGPSGKPFQLDHQALRLTLIGAGGAVEYQGCTPA